MDNQGAAQVNDKALKDQAALEQFVEQLMKERAYPGSKPEQAQRVKTLLLNQINEAINTHLVNALSEKDQVLLDELLDKNPTDEELNKFYMEKIPNLEAEIASALLNFRAAYLYKAPEQVKVEPAASTSTPPNSSVPPPPPPAPVMASDSVN